MPNESPSLADILAAVKANNDDINFLKTTFETSVASIETDTVDVRRLGNSNNLRLNAVEREIELLKQEKIKNNIRISGFHKECDPVDLVFKIAPSGTINRKRLYRILHKGKGLYYRIIP